jgi:hypothetical protein
MTEPKAANIIGVRDVALILAEMTAQPPCPDCTSEAALVLDGHGDVVTSHEPTCPTLTATKISPPSDHTVCGVIPLGDITAMRHLVREQEPCSGCASVPAVHLGLDPEGFNDPDWNPVLLHDVGCPVMAAKHATRVE